MTEEEKKAIETTKTLIEYAGDAYIPKKNREKLQILLNLIEKQQKEIEQLKVLEDDIKDKRIAYIDTPEFENVFIRKDEIREKIKELEGRIHKYYHEDIGIDEYEEDCYNWSKINLLNELLEENYND